MREIKFRAWDKQLKYFLDVEAHFSNEVSIIPDVWSRGNFTPARFEADQTNILLLQYTGLKDRNGVEIYEGDIVKVDEVKFSASKTVDDIGKILFKDGSFNVFDKDEDVIYWPECRDPDEWEVIGNIYENGDLLK